jgi:hypothetical protein
MSQADSRWVLAFDASCSACRDTSTKVAHACDHKLEVLPLNDENVEQWRTKAYGQNPPWAPTLFLLRGSTVRAWTGRAMAVQMVRAVGVKSSLRVLRAIGNSTEAPPAPASSAEHQMSRKHFLNQLAVGGALASGLLLFGRLPALAAPAPTPEELWVTANRDQLPQTYSELLDFDVAHRKAIYQALPAENRRDLWVTQFQQYKDAHPALTTEQARVLDRALDLAGQPSTFTDAPLSDDLLRQLEELRVTAIDAFGIDEGRALFATLGPTDGSAARAAGCGCSCTSNWCDGPCVCCGNCNQCSCSCSSIGCGTLLRFGCNGTCA